MSLTYYERGPLLSIEGVVYRINEAYRYMMIHLKENVQMTVSFDALVAIHFKK